MSIKLIAIDLDGTLLNESHQISPPVKQSIYQARKQGVKDIAQFITAINEQDGVAIAINKFL